jgi:hypothetical protein
MELERQGKLEDCGARKAGEAGDWGYFSSMLYPIV